MLDTIKHEAPQLTVSASDFWFSTKAMLPAAAASRPATRSITTVPSPAKGRAKNAANSSTVLPFLPSSIMFELFDKYLAPAPYPIEKPEGNHPPRPLPCRAWLFAILEYNHAASLGERSPGFRQSFLTSEAVPK